MNSLSTFKTGARIQPLKHSRSAVKRTSRMHFRVIDVPCNPLEKVGYILDAITHDSYKIET